MYCDKYAPWDHYPKTLKLAELQNPMNVIIDFFSADGLTGHCERLKDWRDYVIADHYFNHKSSGPGFLVIICEQNQQLLEAMFLLLLQHENDYRSPKIVSQEQIDLEKERWCFFPDNLTDDEMRQPYLAIKQIFEKIEPQQYRDYLNEWLYLALSNLTNDESLSAGEIISVYENILKMYSAAWILHQRETTETCFKDDQIPEHISNTEVVLIQETKDIPQLLTQNLTPGDVLGLKELTKFILKNEPLVKAIFHIGTLKEPFTYFLYILIDSKRYFLDYGVNKEIEDFSKSMVPLFVLMDSVDFNRPAAFGGCRFIDYVLKNGSMVYLSNGLNLPSVQPGSPANLLAENKAVSEWWQKQINLHMISASYFSRDQDYTTALYYLHQALEMALLKLLQIKTGFSTTIPNFQRLIKMTLLFTNSIYDFFESLCFEEKELHYLLWNVHPIELREKLTVNESQIKRLTDIATKLFVMVDELIV
jgi:HEPN domain-containing protein